MNIQWVCQQVEAGIYEWSGHADDERQAERIPIEDVEDALRHGEILEAYPHDRRGPSCLVLGYSRQGYAIHIVCGQTPLRRLRLITVYTPSPPKWIDDRTRRR
ncbi:MAG: DUF4258 domain-containing protein [Pseudomonadota bacterium]